MPQENGGKGGQMADPSASQSGTVQGGTGQTGAGLTKPEPVDVGNIPVGEFIKRYPSGKLLGLVSMIFASGYGAGQIITRQFDTLEIQQYKAAAEAQGRVAATLQQAISAGNCVKSRELMRADAARAVIGRLDLLGSTVAQVKKRALTGQGLQEVAIHDAVLKPDIRSVANIELLLDDPRVREGIAAVEMLTPSVNQSSKGLAQFGYEPSQYETAIQSQGTDVAWAYARFKADIAAFEDSVLATREYVKAKYLSLDP